MRREGVRIEFRRRVVEHDQISAVLDVFEQPRVVRPQIVAHRVVWSFVVLVVLLTATRRWAALRAMMTRRVVATYTLAAILIAPGLNLEVNTLSLLVVSAYAAAVVGRMQNLPATFAQRAIDPDHF